MARTTPRRRPSLASCVLRCSLLIALSSPPAAAADCASPAGLSPCFDANALWLPAGDSNFMVQPGTGGRPFHQASFGFASELLHQPVRLHASSPDPAGRDVRVVDFALDASLFATYGLEQDLELSAVLPLRAYQNGAGLGAVTSQASPEIASTALRDPRIGLGYSLDDRLHAPGLGLRLGFDASLPLGNEAVFSGERSFVASPSLTLAFQRGPFRSSASLGLRLRRALDFAGVHLGNQAFVALGVGVQALEADLLGFTVEAFGSPPLTDGRAPTSGAPVSEVSLFPAEWLASVRTSFGTAQWSLGLGAGTGLPLSSETRRSARGSSSEHFLGATAPDFRSVLVLRYAP